MRIDPDTPAEHSRNRESLRERLADGVEIVDLTQLEPTECPCGVARRAFAERPDGHASVHLTEIHHRARTHYHRHLTETYVILECGADAAIELDGRQIPVSPLTTVVIPPGVRHRAIGEMRVIIFCTPPFDPDDEFVD
jgi:mannose-6-phosphate isomerase-like protein (cupin superfamily)